VNFCRPGSPRVETFTSGAEGIELKFRSDQISSMLTATRHRLDVCLGESGDGHRFLMTSAFSQGYKASILKVLCYILIFSIFFQFRFICITWNIKLLRSIWK